MTDHSANFHGFVKNNTQVFLQKISNVIISKVMVDDPKKLNQSINSHVDYTSKTDVFVTKEQIINIFRVFFDRDPLEYEIPILASRSVLDLKSYFLISDEFTEFCDKSGIPKINDQENSHYKSNDFKHSDVLFFQTSDAFVCKEMLDLTSRTIVAYCQKNGFLYESFVGIKRGVAPWMAIYNRIVMLQELVQRGYCGWVVYLDADAFINEMSFDIGDYFLSDKSYCFIAAGGGSPTPWDINSGTFFINLGDQDGRLLVREWVAEFEAQLPYDFLANPASKRADISAQKKEYPSDQDLIYEPLKKIISRVRKVDGLINYTDGRFIRQAIRASFSTFDARVAWIRAETDRVMAEV